MSVILDTHTAIWYFQGAKDLSSAALRIIRRELDRRNVIYISAISLVETIYLVERGRLPREALHRLRAGVTDTSAGFFVRPVDENVADKIHEIPWSAVPDMPDRIIAATALQLGIPLITRDQRLQSAGIPTIW